MTVIVVGGGPAGVKAALRAHVLGAEVRLVESERLAAASPLLRRYSVA